MLQRFAQIGVARAERSAGAVKKVDGNDLCEAERARTEGIRD